MDAYQDVGQPQQSSGYAPNPHISPPLSASENRIAQAVITALNTRLDTFEHNIDKRFTDHMTELEGYYAERDEKHSEDIGAIKKDFERIIGLLSEKGQS